MVNGKLFLFAALLFKAEQKQFPGGMIVFNLQVHHRADPGQHAFFGKPGKHHSNGCHVLFDRGRRG
jgi:hypothetical protein